MPEASRVNTLSVNRQNIAKLARVKFQAMASDCELLFQYQDALPTALKPDIKTLKQESACASKAQANRSAYNSACNSANSAAKHHAETLAGTLVDCLAEIAIAEVKRIEHKYSRYRAESELNRINAHAGQYIDIDAETFGLLSFARQCFALSGGLFDITSAPLQHRWGFGLGVMPDAGRIAEALSQVGFERLAFTPQSLYLPAGMSLDFGGIAKEYAADRALMLMQRKLETVEPTMSAKVALLVNLGGDIAASRYPWRIGIEGIAPTSQASALVSFPGGGLATSGDTRRYLMHEGKRIGHILSPKTGYPVAGAPRSVTVMAPSASAAGMLATLSMLKGPHAEAFLAGEGLTHWVQRDETDINDSDINATDFNATDFNVSDIKWN